MKDFGFEVNLTTSKFGSVSVVMTFPVIIGALVKIIKGYVLPAFWQSYPVMEY